MLCAQLAAETEVRRLQQQLAELELQLAETRRSEIEAREQRDIERLKNALSPPQTRTSSRSSMQSGDGELAGMKAKQGFKFRPKIVCNVSCQMCRQFLASGITCPAFCQEDLLNRYDRDYTCCY